MGTFIKIVLAGWVINYVILGISLLVQSKKSHGGSTGERSIGNAFAVVIGVIPYIVAVFAIWDCIMRIYEWITGNK